MQQFERRAWEGEYRSDLDLIFTGLRGVPKDPDAVTKRFGRVVTRMSPWLGIRVVRFHDLRHTHATLLLGLDAKYVSERLGHDSVQTTLELYGHVTSTRRWHAALRIGDMLDGPQAGNCDPVVIPEPSESS